MLQAHEIRNGDITREEGIALVKKYDLEFPERFLDDFLDYISIDERRFSIAANQFEMPVIDRDYFMDLHNRFASPHLWYHENGKWHLRHKIWEHASKDMEKSIDRAKVWEGNTKLDADNVRIIAKLDIKGPRLIKGIRYEGVRVIGDPQVHAKKYYEEGIDEIIYIDTVVYLYNRNSLHDLVEQTAQNVFIPITVGGGIRSIDDAYRLLRSGADKVAINCSSKKSLLIKNVAEKFGSQCMVLSIQACKQEGNFWEVYTDNGREHSGLNVLDWAKRGVELAW